MLSCGGLLCQAKAKDKQLKTWDTFAFVEGAGRQELSLSSSASMPVCDGLVVTFDDGGQLKARLVVQVFTDQRLEPSMRSVVENLYTAWSPFL